MSNRRPVPILINAVLIFGMCFFLFFVALYGLILYDNPFAVMGAFIFIPVATRLAWWQYRSVVHRSVASTRRLAIAFFTLAGFFSFGLASNVLEHLFKTPPPDCTPVGSVGFLIIVAILAFLAVYFSTCGLLNWKWQRALQPQAEGGNDRDASHVRTPKN
jgi:hypothetical protein